MDTPKGLILGNKDSDEFRRYNELFIRYTKK
jgi:hypothetical protein